MEASLNKIDAAKLAGVSVETLTQYCDFGLLKAEELNGEKFFRHADIATVFHLQSKESPTPHDTAIQNTETQNTAANITSVSPTQDHGQSAAHSSGIKNSQQRSASRNSVHNETTPAIDQSTTPLSSTQSGAPATSQEAGTITVDSVLSSTPSIAPQPAKAAALQPEVSSYNLMDINSELRERLAELKEERDWLRKRLEKMEMRSERDQMLLLSENDNVRRLLPQGMSTGQRLLSAAFPWLGFQKSNASENQNN